MDWTSLCNIAVLHCSLCYQVLLLSALQQTLPAASMQLLAAVPISHSCNLRYQVLSVNASECMDDSQTYGLWPGDKVSRGKQKFHVGKNCNVFQMTSALIEATFCSKGWSI
jgi:hypothetical protein